MLSSVEATSISKKDAERSAEEAFRAVFEYGPKIEFDHHLVYFARKLAIVLSKWPVPHIYQHRLRTGQAPGVPRNDGRCKGGV